MNLIFEGKHVIVSLETFNKLKEESHLVNSKTDNTGDWYFLRQGFAYKVIVED